jgi:FKBP-type peptidyl-prolyl cis-trans isomerase FkpA
MNLRIIAGAAGLVLLAGCLDAPTASRCNRINTEIASVSGDTVTTTTGLIYFDGELGSGAVMQSCFYASIHARGGAQGGPIVYDTRETGGVLRISPGRDNVMQGLAEGIIGMQAGGIRTLIIPSHLGFGAQGDPVAGIPGNATMEWIVEMIRVSED